MHKNLRSVTVQLGSRWRTQVTFEPRKQSQQCLLLPHWLCDYSLSRHALSLQSTHSLLISATHFPSSTLLSCFTCLAPSSHLARTFISAKSHFLETQRALTLTLDNKHSLFATYANDKLIHHLHLSRLAKQHVLPSIHFAPLRPQESVAWEMHCRHSCYTSAVLQ
jgi:hypothetical protein